MLFFKNDAESHIKFNTMEYNIKYKISQFHGIQYKISSTKVWNMIHEVQYKIKYHEVQ